MLLNVASDQIKLQNGFLRRNGLKCKNHHVIMLFYTLASLSVGRHQRWVAVLFPKLNIFATKLFDDIAFHPGPVLPTRGDGSPLCFPHI